MLKTSIFQLQIVCPGCNNNIAVSGITDFDTCQNCGKNVNVLSIINERLFGIVHKDKYMAGYLSGSIEQIGGSGAYKLSYSSMQPYCEECLNPVTEAEAMDAINAGKPYECTKCGHKMPVRDADSILKEFHPKAVGVLNDAYGKDSGERNTDKDSMLVFKCMTCGAGLELTSKTKRTIKCNYCDNENYLPDSIWTKLHPNKEVQPLFVILDLNENDINGSVKYFLDVTAARVFGKHFDNFIKQYFEKPFVSEAIFCWMKAFLSAENNSEVSFNLDIAKIQKNFYDNIALGYNDHLTDLKITAAASGKNIPEALQHLMAEDKNEQVRLALAGNGNLAKSTVKLLQSDSSAAVKEKTGKIKTGFLSRLFGK